jgi:KUP system potassium uptake protein
MLPAFNPYVLPVSVLILVALFAIQPQGTARIGRTFGPIMALWFLTIALLGIWGIARYPSVLFAIDPRHAISYLLSGGATGFFVLGGVFLCVTGAEALYADMGHFGAGPIRLAWSAVVFPSLVLNYAGQAALVLDGAPSSDNIFYRLCPSFLLLPLVALATIATVIASQSIITGAFSMTRQAIQLGWLPRVHITQTSAEGYGQIYVGSVNRLLMLVTLGLTVGFGKSDNLASAYGIAVSATMLMTSVLLFIAMREIWGWSLVTAGLVAGVFMLVDAAFFVANFAKVAQGGYVPLILAALVYGVMLIWHVGATAVSARLQDAVMPVDTFMARIAEATIPRVPGTAVFPDAYPAGCATGHGVARQAQPRAARESVRPDSHHAVGALGQGLRAAYGRSDGSWLLACGRSLRLHGAPRHSGAAPAGARRWMHHRSLRRHLLCRPRDRRARR